MLYVGTRSNFNSSEQIYEVNPVTFLVTRRIDIPKYHWAGINPLIVMNNNSLLAVLGSTLYVISLPAFNITRTIDLSSYVTGSAYIAQGVVAGRHGYFIVASGKSGGGNDNLLQVDFSGTHSLPPTVLSNCVFALFGKVLCP